jgi:hypothetical protein
MFSRLIHWQLRHFSGNLVRKHKLSLSHGICVPAACSVDKVNEFSNQLLSLSNLEAIKTTCATNDAVKFTAIDIIAM